MPTARKNPAAAPAVLAPRLVQCRPHQSGIQRSLVALPLWAIAHRAPAALVSRFKNVFNAHLMATTLR